MILHVRIPSVCTGSLSCDFQALGFLTKQLNIRLLVLQCNRLRTTRLTYRLQHFFEKRIFVFGDSKSDSVGVLYWSPPGKLLINFPFSSFYSFRIIIRLIQKIWNRQSINTFIFSRNEEEWHAVIDNGPHYTRVFSFSSPNTHNASPLDILPSIFLLYCGTEVWRTWRSKRTDCD